MCSSSPPSLDLCLETCQVCDGVAHGTHFDAITCRACAAFFRRAVLGKYLNIACQTGTEKCGARRNGRFFCKKCRLKQCLSVGMNPDRFQLDRDLISTTDNFVIRKKEKKTLIRERIPTSIETLVGRPSFLMPFDLELISPDKFFIDTSCLLRKAADVLKMGNFPSVLSKDLNGLQKMAFGLSTVREPDSDHIERWTKMGKKESLYLCEEDFLCAASWLNYCDELKNLPASVKVQLLITTWQLWTKLEKITLTAEMRTKKKCPDRMVMAAKKIMVDSNDIEIDTSWFSNYDIKQLKYFIDPRENEFIDSLIASLIKLQPTPMEQAYMLAQICFQFAGKQFQGHIMETTESIHENLSNDLHNYYVNELKMPNYSGRLSQLMKINNNLKKDWMERAERNRLARLFNIFKVEFSHPEIFYGNE